MKNLLLAIIFILFSGGILSAQTAEEIILRYLEMSGGMEHWEGVEGIKTVTKLEKRDYVDSIVTIQMKNGQKIKFMTIHGKENISQAFDGQTAWRMNQRKPELLTDDQTEILRSEVFDFPLPFVSYREKGFEIEFLGVETLNEQDVYKIKVTKHTLFINGELMDNIAFYYFDAENNMPVLTETIDSNPMMDGKMKQTWLSDYRRAGPLLFPFRIEETYENSALSNVYLVQSITLNPIVEDQLFDFPGEN